MRDALILAEASSGKGIKNHVILSGRSFDLSMFLLSNLSDTLASFRATSNCTVELQTCPFLYLPNPNCPNKYLSNTKTARLKTFPVFNLFKVKFKYNMFYDLCLTQ